MALLNSQVLTAPKETRGMYKADRRLYLDAKGNVVEADDPNRLTLLVHEGGTLPLSQARELGLTDQEDAPSKSAREQRAEELGKAKEAADVESTASQPSPTTEPKPTAKKAAIP